MVIVKSSSDIICTLTLHHILLVYAVRRKLFIAISAMRYGSQNIFPAVLNTYYKFVTPI